MSDNFEVLETGQIEIMHQQIHTRFDADGETDCDMLRVQHDGLAAEMVKRGIDHTDEIICPDSELALKAPNYRRGFTDDVCTQCAFGQLVPFCNLYKADYTRGYTCDSFQYFEILELESPHGFLMGQGKQVSYADIKQLDTSKAYLVISDGEAFGIATFNEPAQMNDGEFDRLSSEHKVTSRERRQWWKDEKVFFVHSIKDWIPYENGIKLYQDGKVINEPKASRKGEKLVESGKLLPRVLTIIKDAVMVTEDKQFLSVLGKDFLTDILAATYEVEPEYVTGANEAIPIYSLALVRNPRMRIEGVKQGDAMPFEIRKREDEYCVIKIESDGSEGAVSGCHDTEAEADAQLTALNINVVAEEERAVHTDKPKKRKPKKKTFLEGLKTVGKSIADFLLLADEQEKIGVSSGNVGIMQKDVNGEIWHFTWSTNAFEDREKEIFSTKSLERYVIANEKNKDKGRFNLWHINQEDGNFNTDFAIKKWQGVVGRFLVEAGPYTEDVRGQSAKAFFAEYSNGHPTIAPEGWGCSPEYKYLPEERATGVYENIWITRTSTLPRMAAANIWTDTMQFNKGNGTMDEKQMVLAKAVLGDELLNLIIKQGEAKTSELEDADIAHKENSGEGVEKAQEVSFSQEQFDLLAQEIGKQFSKDNAPLVEALTGIATKLGEINERVESLEIQQDAKTQAETPKYTFSLQRASDGDSTIVAEDDALKNSRPQENNQPMDAKTVTPDRFFGKVR